MTDSNSDSDGPPTKKTKIGKKDSLPVCPYGATCFRKNPVHFKEYTHPEKKAKKDMVGAKAPTTTQIDTSSLPPCAYGAKCYRKNLLHFAEFSHPTGSADDDDLPEDSGSDTDVCDDDDDGEEGTSKSKKNEMENNEVLKRGMSLAKKYTKMSEDERRELIMKAFEAKKYLEDELQETKQKMQLKDKELQKLQKEVNTGVLLLDGEKEALEGKEPKHFHLMAERTYKEGSAAQVHFRLVESQFYRLLSGAYGSGYQVSKVEYVVVPQLVKRFKEAREELKEHRGEDMSYPVLAFHGTGEANITPIVESGFKIPGEKGFTHKTDTGYYGKGVYFSEFPNYSMGYIQGATKLLLCQVLLGKSYQCTKLIHGHALTKGFDSHTSPCKKELIIFNGHHILPCYIVHYKTATVEFKYIKPPDQRRRLPPDDLMKLYWKASKTKKSNILAGYTVQFAGKLSDMEDTLNKLVKKHGGQNAIPSTPKPLGLFGTPCAGFNLLVTREVLLKLKKVPVLITQAKTYNVPIVREEFIYDSILKKERQEVEDYTFDE